MRRTNQPSGQPAHELLAARHEADVRTAVAWSQAELLALTNGDVGAVFAGGREEGEADRVDARNRERAGIVCAPDQVGRVDQEPKEIGLLEDHRGGLRV